MPRTAAFAQEAADNQVSLPTSSGSMEFELALTFPKRMRAQYRNGI